MTSSRFPGPSVDDSTSRGSKRAFPVSLIKRASESSDTCLAISVLRKRDINVARQMNRIETDIPAFEDSEPHSKANPMILIGEK